MKIAYFAHHMQYLPYQLPIKAQLEGIIITTDHSVFKYLQKNFPELDHLQYIDVSLLEHALLRQEIDTLVVSDHYPDFFQRIREVGCRIVHTLHGVSLKPHLTEWSYDEYDLTLVPSAFIYERIVQSGKTHFLHRLKTIGLPKLDSLMNQAWDRDQLRQSWGFDERPVVLYAPTWNNHLIQRKDSSLTDVGLPFLKQWPEKWNAIIKLHPNTYRLRPELVGCVRDIVDASPHMRLVEAHHREMLDNIPLYLMSDALLGDVSSVNIDYYAVGKPMVLIKPSDPAPDFDPFWEDVLMVKELKELQPALEKVLQEDPYLEKRARSSPHLLGPLDGESTARAVAALEELTSNY